jgi:homoserine O-acetyltransferase
MIDPERAPMRWSCCLILATALLTLGSRPLYAAPPRAFDGYYVLHDFHFASGETLPELRIHYTALGRVKKDSHGHVTNAVLILHDTGGSAGSFMNERFSGVLFGPGQLLDAEQYFIILPDGIGHGKSSKPSDALRGLFPQYTYADMVAAQYALVTKGLEIDHLRLIIGTSMGCMHTFMWGEAYPDFMDALMPLACLPVPIAGRNRIWRDLAIDAIRSDPQYNKGNYSSEPANAMRIAASMLLIADSAPIQMQLTLPSRAAADEFVQKYMALQLANLDANDTLYALDSSRDYDPSANLEKIQAPLLHINSADDFVNPPDLGIAEREIKRVKKGRFILLPASERTYGHGTHTWAAVWQQYLAQLLETSKTATN